MFNVEISWNFDTVVQKSIFCFFIWFFMKIFPIAVVLLLYKNLIFFSRIWSPHVVLYYRKHFYSILTNLSNFSHSKSSMVPFAKFKSDLKNVPIKHFPTMQPFANVLQIGLLINFLIFPRKYLCWSIFLIKLHCLMVCKFIKI